MQVLLFFCYGRITGTPVLLQHVIAYDYRPADKIIIIIITPGSPLCNPEIIVPSLPKDPVIPLQVHPCTHLNPRDPCSPKWVATSRKWVPDPCPGYQILALGPRSQFDVAEGGGIGRELCDPSIRVQRLGNL